MCLLSGGQVYLMILSSVYVCSTLSNPNITRNTEDLSPEQSTIKKQAKHLLKEDDIIHKSMRKNLKNKIQQTVLQLESQLFYSQIEYLIGEEHPNLKNKIKSVGQEQSNLKTEVRSKFRKRSPHCLLRCLRQRQLHPAQCHYLCTMSVG